ncbi:hypothetical protein PHLCEN_2v678 [Hermanssonia centrifuga]|uniref:Uncharacterized protein n=1 Tax=Hermanssonia centrifuga TaxID=98765 RepID=A0A2R6S5A3_9APHY|nr:hypothetical protein PHLCEN_2v678 [Hermanssonia centrifuga]
MGYSYPRYSSNVDSVNPSVPNTPVTSSSLLSLLRSSTASRSNGSALHEPTSPSVSGTSERLPGFQDSSTSARTDPVIYMFAHADQSYNGMLLQSQRAMIPLYHISVRLNCFVPSSYITIINRGDSEHGEEVGQFE